tara:strand:+ start:984 stop:1259 length:276 start_codon:yes stop_codon:yes gene_type:complete
MSKNKTYNPINMLRDEFYDFGGDLYNYFNRPKNTLDYKNMEFARKTVTTPKGEKISRPLTLLELFLTQQERGIGHLPNLQPITNEALKGRI